MRQMMTILLPVLAAGVVMAGAATRAGAAAYEVFVTSVNPSKVYRANDDGSGFGVFGTAPIPFDLTFGPDIDPDGAGPGLPDGVPDLFVTTPNETIHSLSGVDGSAIGNNGVHPTGVYGAGMNTNLIGLDFNATQTLVYAASPSNSAVYQKVVTGPVVTPAGDVTTLASGGSPVDVHVASDGAVYVANGSSLLRYTTGGTLQQTTTSASGDIFRFVFGPDITSDGKPEAYVSAGSDLRAYDVLGNTGAPGVQVGGPLVTGLNTPLGPGFGPDGRLYVANYGNNQVLRYTNIAGTWVADATPFMSFAEPADIAFRVVPEPATAALGLSVIALWRRGRSVRGEALTPAFP